MKHSVLPSVWGWQPAESASLAPSPFTRAFIRELVSRVSRSPIILRGAPHQENTCFHKSSINWLVVMVLSQGMTMAHLEKRSMMFQHAVESRLGHGQTRHPIQWYFDKSPTHRLRRLDFCLRLHCRIVQLTVRWFLTCTHIGFHISFQSRPIIPLWDCIFPLFPTKM